MNPSSESQAAPRSWATATWSVPGGIVIWLLVTLLLGLLVPAVSENENVFYAIAALIAAAMAVAGSAISRRGGSSIRGLGTGLLHAGIACAVVALVVIVQ